jgi:hypothetical protein
METKIDLLGIVRNTSNLNSPAGAMHEMINLRKRYGSWRPILPKLAIKTNFAPSNEMFIHSMDEQEFYITYNTDGTIKALTDQGATVQTLTTLATGLDIKFNALANFLIINDQTNFKKYIFKYFPATAFASASYTEVDDIPSIDMAITSENTSELFTYNATYDNDAFQAGWELLAANMRTHYPEYFEGYVFVKWGIELIDGTVLKQSMPAFVYVGDISLTHIVSPADALQINAYRSLLRYTISDTLPSDWNNYYNIIRGVSIFMTKPVSKYDLSQSGIDNMGGYLGLYEKPIALADLFKDESLYYKVYHIPYGAISASATDVIGTGKNIVAPYRINTTLFDNRITQANNFYGLQNNNPDFKPVAYNPADLNISDITAYDVLPTDDVSHHTLLGMRSLNYNGRIFMGDIYTKLFDGFNIDYVLKKTGGDVTQFNLYIEVDLDTEWGVRTVRQTTTSTKDTIEISYLLGYPDIRAVEMRIMHDSGGTLKKVTMFMIAHPVLNYSCITYLPFIVPPRVPPLPLLAKDITGGISIAISDITEAATLATLYTTIRDKNRVQLTELFNPYINPAIYSYQVGEGNIIALAVNMQPLEDRFGTFPVFVFTSRGIWAMNMSDTGEVVVNNIVPLSSAVCTNENSIVVIENLLVFLASDGVKLLSGQNPQDISDIARENPLSVLLGNDQYEQIKAQALINVVTDQISTVDLLEYCQDASFAYNKKLNELIISDYNYKYSYVYGFNDKMWYKVSERYKRFILHYPDTYALRTGNDLINMSEEDTSGSVPAYFESKPILIGPDKEVKLNRITLGGRFDIASGLYGALYIFGSNDGSKWALITGKEISGTSIYNIIIPRLPISLRYLIFVFSGTIKETSSISEFRIQS